MLQGFSVIRRNYGHWDITSREHGRLFRLRGGPGDWHIFDERDRFSLDRARPANALSFKEQSAAMAFICAELMHELLTVDGDRPHVMESWNVDRKEPRP